MHKMNYNLCIISAHYESLREKFEQRKKTKESIENSTIYHTLKLTFFESVFGCSKTLHLQRYQNLYKHLNHIEISDERAVKEPG